MQKGQVINACREYLRTLIGFLGRMVNVLHKSRINDATCAAVSRGCLGCLTARVEILRYKKKSLVCEL